MHHVLSLFTDIRREEVARALLMTLAVFLLLTAYYVIKTVREPLILASGSAELKAYAAAGQAAALLLFVPAYSAISSRVSRGTLIAGVTWFFFAGFIAFYGPAAGAGDAEAAGIEGAVQLSDFLRVGFLFYVFVGIFSLASIAQFWSFANDIYTREQGNRLFPFIGVGATVGAAAGSFLPGMLLDAGLRPADMLLLASGILLAHGVMLYLIHRSTVRPSADGKSGDEPPPLERGQAFAMIFRDPYLRAIAGVILLLNIVNTTGEYLLSEVVVSQASALFDAGEIDDKGVYIGGFYSQFFFVVNIATVAVQALVVSRLVKYFGIAGVVLALPLVALASYGLLAFGAGFAVFRMTKTAENTTDYSVMNTAKSLLWLPTSREAKYNAKQAIDTFVVRFGDLLQAGIVWVGLNVLGWTTREFALWNLWVILAWLGLAFYLIQLYKKRVKDQPGDEA